MTARGRFLYTDRVLPTAEYNLAEPWSRQPFDTDLAWALFQEYLFAPPPRALSRMARRPGFPLSWAQLEDLAWETAWKERAARWDDHLDQVRIQTIEQVTREDAETRARRHGALARKLQSLGELEIDKLIAQAKRDPGGFGIVLPRDIVRLIGIGVRTERLALGDVTDKVEVTGPDLSKLSVEQLRELQAMQEKVSGPGE